MGRQVTTKFCGRSPVKVGLLVFLTSSHVASAEEFWSQFIDPDDGRFDASSYLADNAYGILPVPIIITDPAVDGGLDALRNSEDGARFLLTPSVSAEREYGVGPLYLVVFM